MRIALRHSSSLTLALAFTCLLTISVLTLLYFMQLASKDNQHNEIKAIIATDTQGLLDTYRVAGMDGLADILDYRLKNQQAGIIYALINKHNTVIAGNFDYIPFATTIDSPYITIEVPKFVTASTGLPPNKSYTILAKISLLPGEFRLMVGRNISDMQTHQQLMGTLGWSVIAILIFIAVAGFFIGDRVVYRINLIADTAIKIMNTGDLSRRIPVPGNWDDLSKLSQVLNLLFERMEFLMDGVRQVSDNIAHDLRTPLTRIKNQLEMLYKRSEREHIGINDCCEKLLSEADQLLETFAALLRIGNIEAGKWRSEAEDVSLDAIILDVIELYEPLADDKEQTITADLQQTVLKGDKHLLFQAVANLLDNAIKYAPKGEKIILQLEHAADHYIFKIINTGSYVSPEHLEKLFQRFYRTDGARESKAGNGLGLSLVKAIVVLHHGTVHAENTQNGFCIVCIFQIQPSQATIL
jgi:signal transduction histidine kinase